MKINYSPYTLNGKGVFGDRNGALLKVYFPEGIAGYADCHPWAELGDLPLKEQIEKLRKGEFTDLTERSLHFARIDAEARANDVSLFENVTLPKSHWLVCDQAIPDSYSHLKFKDPQLLLSVLPMLGNHQKVRFDSNAKFTEIGCRNFLEKVQLWIDLFDFIEDPFPFDRQSWKTFESQYQVAFALDRNDAKETYSTMVIKPAVESCPIEYSRIIVTSYLDHPLGQLAAAHTASQICPEEVCGLLSHLVYHENPWSEQLGVREQRLIPPKGTGFGFDELLNAQEWTRL